MILLPIARIALYTSLICGTAFFVNQGQTIDPKLQPYHDLYMYQVNSKCNSDQYVFPRNLEVKFTNRFEYPIVGMCSYNYFGTHVIEIDESFWFWATYNDRQTLMEHEFTHCYFHVGHSKDPLNYMFPSIVKLSEDELFKQVDEFLGEHCK